MARIIGIAGSLRKASYNAARRRDGTYAWGVYEDTAEHGRFLEAFLVESWLEHLRQHERVTHADRVLQEHIHRPLREAPKVAHLIAAESP